ncbi:MAG: thiamine-phosphate pyrophosphorylase [Elusimicrobia bacterium]|nr:thiamine-phosphate pyrophosphorylase [Elusimicrobiota bacterium]
MNQSKLLRIIDANYNRAKEGMRVCEDMCRFLFDESDLTSGWKGVRHALTAGIKGFGLKEIVSARNITGDVGRKTIPSESRRRGVADIFYANAQRVKESLRVLEEFAKLNKKGSADALKKVRYKVYDLEKKTIERLSVVSYPRR